MPVNFSDDYRDASGNIHARFVVNTTEGKEYRGEAVYDPKYGRTILDDDVLRLPRDIVIDIKRGMGEFAARLNGMGVDET